MKKWVLFVLLTIMLILPLNVKAGNLDSYVSWTLDMGVVAHQIRNGSDHMTNLALMKVNEKTAYCIQPGVEGDNNTWYSSTTNINDTPLAGMDTKRLSLIGYYGYGYKDHNSKEYYMATQELIWRLRGVEDVYWTDKKYNGNILNVEKEKEEILMLVNNHEVAPAFDFNNKYMIGDTITIKDNKKVLEGYEVYDSNSNVKISGNELIIEIAKDTKFKLRRKKNGASPIYYYKNGYQTIGTFEYAYDFEKEYSLSSSYGRFIVDKYDYYTKSKTPVVNKASLKAAVYGLYDNSGNLLFTKETDESGKAVFDNLKKGIYKVREITPSKGYQLSGTSYSSYIASNRFEALFNDYEKIIENEIIITKFFRNDNDDLIPEEDVAFEIYNSEGLLYNKYKTNKDGIIKISLPYGTYTLCQITTKEGYDMVEDKIINVLNNKDKQEITLVNEKLPEKVEEEKPVIKEHIEEKEDIQELPNTGKNMIFIPFLLLHIIVMLVIKNEKKDS